MTNHQFVFATPSADDVCAAIASGVLDCALERSPRAYLACHVVLVPRTVVVAGELGFWPPMGAFEGVCDGLERIVRDVLGEASGAGWPLDAPAGQYAVINRLQRLPPECARRLAGRAPTAGAIAAPSPSATLGHALVRVDPLVQGPSTELPPQRRRPSPDHSSGYVRTPDASVAG